MSSATIKLTTNLTGLKVDPNALRTLNVIYGRLTRALQSLPEDYIYRKETENLIKTRVKIINNANGDIPRIEKEINCGQVEELILQADKELTYARNCVNWKPWEPLISEAPPNQWAWPPHK